MPRISQNDVDRRPSSCTHCMGTGRCWICDGRGRYEVAPNVWRSCSTCSGSGGCAACTTADEDDLSGAVITLPRQASVTSRAD